MNNGSKKNGGNILKGMAMGLVLGTAVTMIVAGNKKMSKKIRNASENVSDNVSNMLHFKWWVGNFSDFFSFI